jgi:hypothetical protein
VLFAPISFARFLLTSLLARVCPELGALSVAAQMFLSVLLPVWMIEWFITWILSIQPGTSFDGERDSSTLGFMLTTPLGNRDIILGKCIGYTLDSWLGFLLNTPLEIILVLAATMAGAPQAMLLFIALTVFFAALLFGGAALGVALGARFKARGAGAGWSLVITGFLQVLTFVLIGITATFRPPFAAYALPFLLSAILHAALGFLAIHWGARALGRIRIGDVAFEGRKREN